MRVFELVGPIMFGPSSSHTAGACRLSRAIWQILDEPIVSAELELHGSFRTGDSGVVNKALVAGLLGFDTDDDRINSSHELMERSGVDFKYRNVVIEGAHNNTVRYTVRGKDFGFTATGASVGGGMIEISDIDGAKLSVTGDYNTLIAFCSDVEAAMGGIEKIAASLPEKTIEKAEGADVRIIMVKSSYPITDAMVLDAKKAPGVIHAGRHLRFD